jgi:hypothetical protein
MLPAPAELLAPSFGSLQCSLGAGDDSFSLVLCHQCHHPNRHSVGLGQIGSDKLNATVPQGHQEGSVAGQPVQLGDHRRCPGEPARLDGILKFGAIIAVAALNLDELRGDYPASTPRGKPLDSLSLCLKAKTRFALADCGHPEVGDELGGSGSRLSLLSTTVVWSDTGPKMSGWQAAPRINDSVT